MSDEGASGGGTRPDDSESAGDETAVDDPGGGKGNAAAADDAEPAGGEAALSDVLDGPRKLHPLTIPYRFVQQGAGLVVILVFTGLPGSIGAFGPLGGVLALLGIVALAGLVVGYYVAYHRRFEYELTRDTFDIRSGVFSRREREIPLRRIQNVDISQNVVQRALGLAQVNLKTAGGGQTEAQLQYVGEDEADRVQSEVSRLRRLGADTENGEATERTAETVFEITERELGVLAVVSTDFRVLSLLFFGASLFGPSAFSFLEEELFASPDSVVGLVLGPIAGILSVIAIGVVTGLFRATRYYGFKLDRGEEELRYQRGLLQKYSGTIPLSKVQTLTVRENVLARKLGYAALFIETAGQAGAQAESSGSQSAIPLAERDRVRDLARSIEPADLDAFERPPRRARQRYAVRYALVLVALSGLLYLGTLAIDVLAYWYLPLVGLVAVPYAAHLKWKHRGYAVGEDHVVTRNGFWVRQTKVVPFHRVQTTFSTETIFQRNRDLGTVVVDTAGSRSLSGNDPKAVDVDAGTMNDVRETVVDRLYAALDRRRRERRRSR
ncbi:MAG: PH domain-containing protein [Haloarculaceae archaeon]